MNREDLVSEIRKIEIASRNSAMFSLSGNYRSVLKGSGMEISGFKEYSTDDDYRSVDWNVTARSGKLHSRLYQEERENPLFFIVDTSYSMYTGGSVSGKRKSKIEAAAVVMAVIAFSAVFNNDRAGSVFCSDKVEDEQSIGSKSAHIADMVFRLLDHKPEKPFFDLSYALSCIPPSLKRGCCFVISDFKTPLPSGLMNAAGRKTDLIFIRITDPADCFSEGEFSFIPSDINILDNYYAPGPAMLHAGREISEHGENKHESRSVRAVKKKAGDRLVSSGRLFLRNLIKTGSFASGKSLKISKLLRPYIFLTGAKGQVQRDAAEEYLEKQKRMILKEGISFADISTDNNIPAVINDFFLKRRR